jgi:hypothetical protein
MVLIHNAVIRGMNAIYLQCEGVGAHGSEQDIKDFANFCRIWGQLLDEHHDTEERIVFPRIDLVAGSPVMQVAVDQHHVFLDGLVAFVKYMDEVKVGGKSAYDGQKVKAMLDGFGGAIYDHLIDEVRVLNECRKYDKQKMAALWKELSKEIMAEAKKDLGKQVSIRLLYDTPYTTKPAKQS